MPHLVHVYKNLLLPSCRVINPMTFRFSFTIEPILTHNLIQIDAIIFSKGQSIFFGVNERTVLFKLIKLKLSNRYDRVRDKFFHNSLNSTVLYGSSQLKVSTDSDHSLFTICLRLFFPIEICTV